MRRREVELRGPGHRRELQLVLRQAVGLEVEPQGLRDFLVDDEVVVEGRGDGLEGQVVVGRADAAGSEDESERLREENNFLSDDVNLEQQEKTGGEQKFRRQVFL